MLNNFERVRVLNEVLPLIQKFAGCTIVIKYGGAAMKNQLLKDKVIEDLLFLSYIGLKPVLIHGGGPMINHWLHKLKIEPKFQNGLRLTDEKTMEVVEMVLMGKVNQDLVTLVNKKKGKAIGLSGKDASLIIASQLSNKNRNLVGKVQKVNIHIIKLLIEQGYIPIIASVAADLQGKTYNINADTVAGEIAGAMQAEKLILLTDIPGIMYDVYDSKTLFKYLNVQQINSLKRQGIISGGMIPKVDCCVKALSGGVKSAHIIDGRIDHALLLEILTNESTGSMLI